MFQRLSASARPCCLHYEWSTRYSWKLLRFLRYELTLYTQLCSPSWDSHAMNARNQACFCLFAYDPRVHPTIMSVLLAVGDNRGSTGLTSMNGHRAPIASNHKVHPNQINIVFTGSSTRVIHNRTIFYSHPFHSMTTQALKIRRLRAS